MEHPFLMFLDHTQRSSTVGRTPLDEWSARPEESYRLCCVVVCDLETSRMGAPYIYDISLLKVNNLTLILLTWRKWWAPNNASKEQMGFNSGFKGLMFETSRGFSLLLGIKNSHYPKTALIAWYLKWTLFSVKVSTKPFKYFMDESHASVG